MNNNIRSSAVFCGNLIGVFLLIVACAETTDAMSMTASMIWTLFFGGLSALAFTLANIINKK